MGKSCIQTVDFDMTKLAAEKLYKKVGVSAKDVQVVELHNCFSAMSLLHTYEALGLCDVGKAAEFIDAGGEYVVKKSCTNTRLPWLSNSSRSQ